MVATLKRDLKKVRPHSSRKLSLLAELCGIVPPVPITSRQLHGDYMKVLEVVMDRVEATTNKELKQALAEYAGMIADFLEKYEKAHYQNKANSRTILQFLMEQHELKQTDLSGELGGQSVVSDILSGKRKLNAEQIQKLSKRFHVSPATFYPL